MNSAGAQPSGAAIVAGQASVSTPSSALTVINQSSSKAIINWQDFSVASGTTVQFNQPDAASLTLNRVVGSGLSAIDGAIKANGQVWLINPNGVLFGQGATINLGGLLATTADIANADFLSGNYAFKGSPSGSAVVNQGVINAATGGSVVLSAAKVVNKGVIIANSGHVVLGGADSFTVDFKGDGLLSYEVTAPAKGADAGVSNEGVIKAPGGRVLLTARAADRIADGVVNNSGMIEATSAHEENGEIVLDAGDGGAVNSGTLDASGKNAGETGGTVKVLGKSVTVADNAAIDVSGDAGGGTAIVGGDLHGTGPDPNAETVTVGKATIKADAITRGNGGTVAVTSTGKTKVAAAISAKGGALGGDGGQVETSGHTLQVDDATSVTTAAPHGASGDWLLDPGTINIAAAGSDTNYNFTTDPSTTDTVNVSPSTITTALTSGNVTLEANTAINVQANVLYGSTNTLSLLSKGGITFTNAAIQNSSSGNIVLVAGWDGNSHPTGPSTAGTYGLNYGAITIQGVNAAVGSAYGATYLSGYGLSLQSGSVTGTYAQVGYHGNQGGAINIQTLGGGVFLNDYYGNTVQIGNGGYDGAGSLGVTGDISITTTGTTSVGTSGGNARIGNYAGTTASRSGNVSLTTGSLVNPSSSSVAYDVDRLIDDNIGLTNNIGGGAVAVALTNTTAATTINLSYDSPNSATVTTSNTLNVGAISLTGTGNLTLSSVNAISPTSNISVGGSLGLTSTGGGITDDSNITVGGDLVLNAAGAINLTGILNVTGGLSATSQGNITITNTQSSIGGTVTASDLIGTYSGDNAITISAGSSLTLGSVSATGVDYGSIQLISGNGDLNLTGTVEGSLITLTAYGSVTKLQNPGGLVIAHASNGGSFAGGLAVNAQTGSILLDNVNTIEPVINQTGNGQETQIASMGQLVFVAAGSATINVGNPIALYGAYAGGTISISATGYSTLLDQQGGVNAVANDLAIYNPISTSGDIYLTASGNITQMVGPSTDVHIQTPGALFATASTGSLMLNDGGHDENAPNCSAYCGADAGNQIGGVATLNANLGANFTNTTSTVLGGGTVGLSSGSPAQQAASLTVVSGGNLTQSGPITAGALNATSTSGSITLTNAANQINTTVVVGTDGNGNATETPSGTVTLSAVGSAAFTNTTKTVLGNVTVTPVNNVATLDVEVMDGAANTHSDLVLSGAVNVSGTGDTTLHAAGNVINLNGGSQVTVDALNLISDYGTLGGPEPDNTNISYFLGVTINSLHVQTNGGAYDPYNSGTFVNGNSLISSSTAFSIGTDHGGYNTGLGGGFIGASNNAAITQMSGANGTIVTGGNLAISSGTGGFTLNNPGNQVSGQLSLFSPGTVSFTNNGNLVVDQIIGSAFDNRASAAGNVTVIVNGGSVTQTSGGLIKSGNLSVTTNTGADVLDITLTGTNNVVTGTVMLNGAGNVAFANSVNTQLGTSSAGGNSTYAGTLNIQSGGSLTIANGATLTAKSYDSGAITLAAATGFINNAGANALSMPDGGTFHIYSADPSLDTFGNLNSNNTAVYGVTYPTAISQSGNRYIFASNNSSPLVVAAANLSNVYGNDATAQVAADYTVTGGDPGVANAYLGTTSYSGTPSVTSSGAANNANAGSFTITVSQGSFTASGPVSYQNAVLTVTPRPLTTALQGNVIKTYDGTTAAALGANNYTALSGLVNGDAVTLANFANGTYADANAGSAKTVTVNGLSLSGTQASNYTIVSSVSAAIGTISPKALTVSLQGTASKVYDGTTSAVLTNGNYTALGGLVSGDAVTLTSVLTGSYADANAGTAKTVTVTGLTLSGKSAGNYTIASSISGAIGTISQKILTVALQGTVAKTYDGTTSATLGAANYTGLGGIVGSDAVTLTSLPTQGAYDSADIGTGKIVSVSGLTLSGAKAANYTIATSIAGAIGVITAPATTPNAPTTTSSTTAPVTGNTVFDTQIQAITAASQSVINQTNISINPDTAPGTSPSPLNGTNAPATSPPPPSTVVTQPGAGPIGALVADNSGTGGASEPPPPADQASDLLVSSMNGSGSGQPAGTIVIAGLLTSAPHPANSNQGGAVTDDSPGWGNAALWQ